MGATQIAYKNLIIGGTIKAATSSVFSYLSAHPEVCGSSVKETVFFTKEYTGDIDRDRKRYSRFFSLERGNIVAVEATPNYLSYKENVAPRINGLLPDVRLLFILRDPVDRLYSYYNFALGKLELPESLAFEDYIDMCQKYASEELSPKRAGIGEKHLRALEIGAYGKYLRKYLEVFAAERIKVAFFEHLKEDPHGFMTNICRFIEVNPDFYRDYEFNKVNVTFSARLKPAHYIALGLNRTLESVLRQRPGLKRRLVGIYKQFNQSREGYAQMADATRERLAEYYSPANIELKRLLAGKEVPAWVECA